MIDTKNPCAGSSNWKASINATGGTPGKKILLMQSIMISQYPQLKNAYTTDNTNISLLVFDEPVDSLKGATVANYSIDGGLIYYKLQPISPFLTKCN